jgi:NAD(P)H-dependent FMN reductase
MKKTIGIITGSTRIKRKSLEIAEWVKSEAGKLFPADYVIIDLKDYPLPFFGEEGDGNVIQAFEKIIGDCDAFIFVAPEYNHSITGVLKNALDYGYNNWSYKIAGIVSYGFAANGARAAEHLRGIFGSLNIMGLRSSVLLSMYEDMKDDKLELRDFHYSGLDKMLLEMKEWLNLKG